ncbi:hypothetical protein PAXINDRAFT_157645 [Paxillus involutus ATCC 200175]|uniref:Uncharacterized protein n=1 Tax=Paxillus involutus ATCC 200175 TaxID=664439 RepID=A0A0C9TT40_PAXIN|nr:hypothetical protein PAXINDRAFT_157645 [Paxillus involutus ATCC 200175]
MAPFKSSDTSGKEDLSRSIKSSSRSGSVSDAANSVNAPIGTDSSFDSIPETPDISSTSPVETSASFRAFGSILSPHLPSTHITGTPVAIGALRLSQKMRRNEKDVVIGDANHDEDAERDKAKFVLEVARAQRNVYLIEQQLVTAKLDKNVALGNLYKFRAAEVERKLKNTDFDLGHVQNSICKNGVLLCDAPPMRKRWRTSVPDHVGIGPMWCNSVV